MPRIDQPIQVVEVWVERFNAGDALGLAELYHDDAEPVKGRDAVQAMFEREFAKANMECIIEAIHEAGDVAALEWRDPLGLRGCGFFTVRDLGETSIGSQWRTKQRQTTAPRRS
ncbi:MAG: nuclear transport factor 2 family protein [Sinorhizobium meliloti]|nr:nuclear transport factor 2 family protein [Sinorhizobium meliloti]